MLKISIESSLKRKISGFRSIAKIFLPQFFFFFGGGWGWRGGNELNNCIQFIVLVLCKHLESIIRRQINTGKYWFDNLKNANWNVNCAFRFFLFLLNYQIRA